jgi:hypothetical protein
MSHLKSANQTEENNPKKYTVINTARVLCMSISAIVAFRFEYNFFQYTSLFFVFFSILWLILDKLQLVPEKRYPYIVFIPTFLDLIVISVFMFFTGTYYSIAIVGYLYATVVCSLNLDAPQGIFSAIVSVILYSSMSFLVYFKLLPYINIFGEDIDIKFEGIITEVMTFYWTLFYAAISSNFTGLIYPNLE